MLLHVWQKIFVRFPKNELRRHFAVGHALLLLTILLSEGKNKKNREQTLQKLLDKNVSFFLNSFLSWFFHLVYLCFAVPSRILLKWSSIYGLFSSSLDSISSFNISIIDQSVETFARELLSLLFFFFLWQTHLFGTIANKLCCFLQNVQFLSCISLIEQDPLSL